MSKRLTPEEKAAKAAAKAAAAENRPAEQAPAGLAIVRDNCARSVITAFETDQEFVKWEWRPVDAEHIEAARLHPDLVVQ